MTDAAHEEDYWDHPAHLVYREITGKEILKKNLWLRKEVCDHVGTDPDRIMCYKIVLETQVRCGWRLDNHVVILAAFDEELNRHNIDVQRKRRQARAAGADMNAEFLPLVQKVGVKAQWAVEIAAEAARATGRTVLDGYIDGTEVLTSQDSIKQAMAYAHILADPILKLMKIHEGPPKDMYTRRRGILRDIGAIVEKTGCTYADASDELMAEKEILYGKPSDDSWWAEIVPGETTTTEKAGDGHPQNQLGSGGEPSTGEGGMDHREQPEPDEDPRPVEATQPAGDYHPGNQPGD